MRMATMVRAAMVTVLLAGGSVSLGAEMRVAVVNMQKLVQSHPETRARVAALEAQIKEFEAEQREMLGEHEKLKADFEKVRDETRNKALSEQAKDQKVAEAEAKLQELRTYENQIGQTTNKRKQQVAEQKMRIQNQVVTELSRAIEQVAEKMKFDLVIDASNAGIGGVPVIMYFNEKIDITADIMKMIGGVETPAAR